MCVGGVGYQNLADYYCQNSCGIHAIVKPNFPLVGQVMIEETKIGQRKKGRKAREDKGS